MKNTIHLWILITVMMVVLVPNVLAPTAVEFGNPGTTPDSFWYGLELWWESVGANTPEEEGARLQERFAEMHAMIEAGDYDAAHEAAEAATATFENLQRAVEDVEAAGENLDTVHNYAKETFLYEDYQDALKQDLREQAGTEQVSKNLLEETGLNVIEEAITEERVVIGNQEEVITDAIAKEQGITHLEAEFQVEERAKEVGLADQHQKEVEEKLDDVQQQLDQVEQELAQAAVEGREIPPAATELVAETQVRLEQCRNALVDERYGESFGQFTAAEHLIDNAEGFLAGDVSREKLLEVIEFAQDQRIKNHRDYIAEYEEHKEEWNDEFPKHQEDFKEWYEQGQKALELADALTDAYAQQAEQLRAEGKSNEKIFEIITAQFREEYERVYGEPFVPPVVEVEGSIGDLGSIEDLPADAVHTSGGFIEGYTYIDPVTGYTYEFKDDGYTYTTPLGVNHEEKFPQGFAYPKAYEMGTEKHTYLQKTSEGNVEYNYYATGYEIIKSDGKKESFSYSPGKYKLPEGGMFIHEPTGFEYRHEGEAERFDYNPKYDNYVSKEGEHFKPPEGTYFHKEFDYDYSDKKYKVEHGGETWNYDPATNDWTSSTGKSYTPEAHVIAPIGHEKKGSFETETGESWTYDPVKEVWETKGGDKYHTETSMWESGTGKSYDFDSGTGDFIDPQTGEKATDVVWSGETWAYDASTNTWSSSAGESYSGGASESANERVPSGLEGHVDSSGHPYSGESGSHSGESSDGTSGGDSSSTGSHSGSYSGGESGSYSEGDSGSAPSGGDDGGHSGSDGEGGGTGHVVREPRQGEELHPVIKWILKYLGIKN